MSVQASPQGPTTAHVNLAAAKKIGVSEAELQAAAKVNAAHAAAIQKYFSTLQYASQTSPQAGA